MKSGVIVVGSGLAGLYFSIKLAEINPHIQIFLASKDEFGECNSKYASGGIAASSSSGITNIDNILYHFEDTIKAGCGLNDKVMTGEIVGEAPGVIRELIDYGVEFDQDRRNRFDLHIEGGHSRKRIYHKKDETGQEIISKLLEKLRDFNNIRFMQNLTAVEILLDKGKDNVSECTGVLFYDQVKKCMLKVMSDAVILATGGAGQVYGNTTNTARSTGDGIALAKNAGATIAGMEFVQFHPTALFEKRGKRKYLITEALRGDGAKIVNANRESFLNRDKDANSLSPRYLVCHAIAEEMRRSGEKHVFLDCSDVPKQRLQQNFTSFWKKCSEINIDPTRDLIPVVPAAHYMSGGIEILRDGATSLLNLYALGECAYTGMHGANRLASNSLLEAVVIAKNCAENIANMPMDNDAFSIAEGKKLMSGSKKVDLNKYRKKLNDLMDEHGGVIRNKSGLELCLQQIEMLEEEIKKLKRTNLDIIQSIELDNLLVVSREIITASLMREKSIGCFIVEN